MQCCSVAGQLLCCGSHALQAAAARSLALKPPSSACARSNCAASNYHGSNHCNNEDRSTVQRPSALLICVAAVYRRMYQVAAETCHVTRAAYIENSTAHLRLKRRWRLRRELQGRKRMGVGKGMSGQIEFKPNLNRQYTQNGG